MATHQDELKLVERLIAGDKAAAARFADLADEPVWSTVVALIGDNAEGETAYLAILKALSANAFDRLKRYKGRSSLAKFLVLETQNCLGEQTVSLFATDPDKAGRRLNRLYQADFARIAAKHFSKDECEDRLQDLYGALAEDNYRRIRAYRGDKAFGGYIQIVADNEMRDLKRQKTGRLRLPERIVRLSPLHQAVFRAGAWQRVTLDVRSMRAVLPGNLEPGPTPEDIEAAIKELAADIMDTRAKLDAGRKSREPLSLDSEDGSGGLNVPDARTPESDRIEAEERKAVADRLTWALDQADTDLRPLDRAYLSVLRDAWGKTPSAAAIAALLGVAVGEVYACQTRIRRWGERLKAQATKKLQASV